MYYQNHRGVRGKGKLYVPRNTQQSSETSSTNSYKGRSEKNPNISHDNKCCSGLNVKLDLDENDTIFFMQLKNLFNMLKKSPHVVEQLHQYYNSCENPYISFLKLLNSCQDFYSAKTKSLPMLIAEEYQAWCRLHGSRTVQILTDNLKLDAFKFISKQSNVSLTKIVIDVFEMAKQPDIFLDVLKCMIDKKKYKEACQYAILLNLQDNFSIHEFLVPLVLQDKLFGVDEYLNSSPPHQSELVCYLDSVLSNTSVKDAMHFYIDEHQIPEVKFCKVHAKPWKKMIARMVKTYNLSLDLTPNLNKRRNEGALQFLLHKRFIENSFGDESWKEMVQEAIGDDEYLKKELIFLITQYGELGEALRWAKFYNIASSDWPNAVKLFESNPENNRIHQQTFEDDLWADDTSPTVEAVDYHKISLERSKIILVNSEGSFEEFLNQGFQDVDVVGIDCEWKPSFLGQSSELALLQISTRRNVFVVDIVNLGHKTPRLWQELGKFLFNNCDILKLGFSLMGDIHMIRQALPSMNFANKQVGFLDLCTVWKHLDQCPKLVFPYEVHTGGPSLSTLVQICVGKPLDKSEQFSNWEKRPLRESQIVYGALDAYCLIEVYDILRKCCANQNIPFDDICYGLMTNEKLHRKKPKAKKSNRRENKEKIEQPSSPHEKHIFAHEVKFVCDSMLHGLGKSLRKCGIDTVILGSDDDHKECVRHAMDENRFILTRSGQFRMLNGYVCPGYCLNIRSDNLEEQLQQVLKYYKITVRKDHVFSRCQYCNGNSFVKVSRSTMNAIIEASDKRASAPPPADYYDDDIDDNGATGFSSEDELEEAGPPPPLACRTKPVDKKWELYSDEKVDVGLGLTKQGAKIQFDLLPKEVIQKNDIFYVCEECGKVYYDGSHYERVLDGKLKGIVQ